jgi:hypothetical protein
MLSSGYFLINIRTHFLDLIVLYQQVPPHPHPLSFPPFFFPGIAVSFFLPSPFQHAATIFSMSLFV